MVPAGLVWGHTRNLMASVYKSLPGAAYLKLGRGLLKGGPLSVRDTINANGLGVRFTKRAAVSSVAGLALLGAYVAVAVAVGGLSGAGTRESKPGKSQIPGTATTTTAVVADEEPVARVLEGGAWLESVRSGKYFKDLKRQRGTAGRSRSTNLDLGQRSRLGRLNGERSNRRRRRSVTQSRRRNVTTYRTVCVRLCDGYYYPVSPSTTRGRFRKDAAKCASSCAAPTRLYYHRAAGKTEDMVDLKGRKYTRLRTAFLYRTADTSGKSSCQCRPDPWSQQSKDRHKIYALRQERRENWTDRSKRRELTRQIRNLSRSIARARRDSRREAYRSTRKTLTSIDKDERDNRVDQFVVKTSHRENASALDEAEAAELGRISREARKAHSIAPRATPSQRRRSARSANIKRSARRRSQRAKLRQQIRRSQMRLGRSAGRRSARSRARTRSVNRSRSGRRSSWQSRAFRSD